MNERSVKLHHKENERYNVVCDTHFANVIQLVLRLLQRITLIFLMHVLARFENSGM